MKIIGLLLTLIVITAHSFGFELFSILSMIHFFFSSSSFFFSNFEANTYTTIYNYSP